MRLRLLTGSALFVLSSFGLSGPGAGCAWAESGAPPKGQTLTVRAADHGDFTRVVLDGLGDRGGQTLSIRKGARAGEGEIIVSIGSDVPVDVSAVKSGTVRLAGIETPDPAGSGTTIRILAPGHDRFREIRAGSRVLVDIYGPAGHPLAASAPSPAATSSSGHSSSVAVAPAFVAGGSAAPSAPSEKNGSVGHVTGPGAVSESQSSPQAQATLVAPNDTKPPSHSPDSPRSVDEAASSPQKDAVASVVGPIMPAAGVEGVSQERLNRPIQPHVLSFASTEAAGMAAFIRSGLLWVVFDRTNLPVDGRLDGPQKDMFSALKRVDFEGGTAFYTQMPGPANLYTEGGGLVWKVFLTPAMRHVQTIVPERIVVPGQAGVGESGTQPGGPGLMWPTRRAGKVVTLLDPGVGDRLKVATVLRAPDAVEAAGSYVDFDVLRSGAGFVFSPKVDDLSVRASDKGVEVWRPSGLSVSADAPSSSSAGSSGAVRAGAGEVTDVVRPKGFAPTPARGVYNFSEWTMGGHRAMEENRRIIMTGIGGKDETGRAEDLLALARMHVANGWGPEALGFLRIVLQSAPELETNAAFLALRGAARALAGKYELAVRDLMSPALDPDREAQLWRAAVLAGLEDWHQAGQVLPKESVDILGAYPAVLRDELAPVLAEIALRHGQIEEAQGLLALMSADPNSLRIDQESARVYLGAEIARQQGKKDVALAGFKSLAEGGDDLFRVKAGLAYVKLGLEAGAVLPKEAIDRLESMRFGWRGDPLEVLVNARLGNAYLAAGQYAKGLSVLRDAAASDPEGPSAEDIRAEMAQAFEDVFLTDRLDKLSALDAITLYDAFEDLTPDGPVGDDIIRRLAEALVKADLLGRASSLIQTLIDHRLSGPDAAQAAVRLAAIDLLDGRPEDAMASIGKAQSLRGSIVDPAILERMDHDLTLLRARALSGMDKPQQALALLGDMLPDPDVNRLRVDIAWRSGNWDEAAEALADLVLDAEVPAQGPIDADQATMIVNRAVALALADNRLALSNMRDLYGKAMEKTAQARLFDVITRERKAAVLSDRQTLMGVVSEVDLFRNFLDSLKNTPSVSTQSAEGKQK